MGRCRISLQSKKWMSLQTILYSNPNWLLNFQLNFNFPWCLIFKINMQGLFFHQYYPASYGSCCQDVPSSHTRWMWEVSRSADWLQQQSLLSLSSNNLKCHVRSEKILITAQLERVSRKKSGTVDSDACWMRWGEHFPWKLDLADVRSCRFWVQVHGAQLLFCFEEKHHVICRSIGTWRVVFRYFEIIEMQN